MRVFITAELHNGALRGNTVHKTIDIDDEDFADMSEIERDSEIHDIVEDEVLSNMVGWDWEIAK